MTESKTHFLCAKCHEVFLKIPGEDELAYQQYVKEHPEADPKDRVALCDDCFKEFMRQYRRAVPLN